MKVKSISNKDRYGNMFSVEFFEESANVPPMDIPQYDHPGEPKGPDTVPAWLTPGEFVVNAEAVRMFEPQIEAMNNMGREVQKAQGGTIPEYASEGGFISGLKSLLGIPEAGKVNTESMGVAQRNLFNQADVITPELMDAVKQVESGGDPNAVSKAGAMGAYQIIPSEDMGYGIGAYQTPGQNEQQDRAIAQSYLAGIAAENPDYTMEEVLQAYNAGPGRMAAFKAGQGEPLTDETIQYPAKVAEAMGGQLPSREAEVPQPDTSFMDQAKRSLMYPLEPLGFATPMDAPGKPTGTIIGTDSNLMDTEQFSAPFKNIGTELYNDPIGFLTDPISDVADRVFGPVPESSAVNTESMSPEQREIYEANLMQDLSKAASDELTAGGALYGLSENAQRGIPLLGAEEELNQAEQYLEHHMNQGTVTQSMIDDVNEAKEKVEGAKEGILQQEKDKIASADKQDALKQEAEKALGKDPETKQKAQEEAEKIVEETKDADTPESKGTSPSAVQQAAQNTDPDLFEEIGGWFKEAFSDMFDSTELAKMVMLYAGSRVLGYDHNGSLQYSMKNYLTNVSEDIAAREKFILDEDNLKDYTKESLMKYRKSGDIRDLVERGGGASIKKAAGNAYLPGVGKVQVFADTNGVEYVEYQGKMTPVSALAQFIEPWDDDFADASVINRYKGYADSQVAVANSGLDEKNQIKINPDKIGNQANQTMRSIMRRNGVSINEAQPLYNSINGAIDDFIDATVQAKQTGKDVPKSLEPFIELRTFQPLTGIAQSNITGTSAENLRSLNKRIRGGMDNKDPSDTGYNEEYQEEWRATKQAWDNLGVEGQAEWIGKAAKREGWSGFTYWMSQTSDEEVNKLAQQKQ